MKKLDGKVALVTGGNSGIGLAIAKRFAAEGAHVYVTGRREAELAAAVADIPGARGVRGDVAKLEDLDALFETIREERGHLDVLVANAGSGALGALGSISEADYQRVFDLNVRGTIFTVQKALPLLRAGGSVILTGSTTGVMGTAGFSVYSASKAAVRNLARSWALDLKGTDLRVNVLSPGPTDTPGLGRLAQGAPEGELFASLAAQTALGRIGTPDEIAAVALFLASSDSSFMTGSEVFVDGGAAQI